MSSASYELQKAIYTALSAHAPLITLLGAPRIYDDVPRDAAFPYVTLGETSVADWSTGSEDGLEHLMTLHVWSRATGEREVHLIMSVLRERLHDGALTIAGHRLVNLRQEFQGTRRDGDGETYHGIARYRAVTEPV